MPINRYYYINKLPELLIVINYKCSHPGTVAVSIPTAVKFLVT